MEHSESTKIVDDLPLVINVVGKWVYYISVDDRSAIKSFSAGPMGFKGLVDIKG